MMKRNGRLVLAMSLLVGLGCGRSGSQRSDDPPSVHSHRLLHANLSGRAAAGTVVLVGNGSLFDIHIATTGLQRVGATGRIVFANDSVLNVSFDGTGSAMGVEIEEPGRLDQSRFSVSIDGAEMISGKLESSAFIARLDDKTGYDSRPRGIAAFAYDASSQTLQYSVTLSGAEPRDAPSLEISTDLDPVDAATVPIAIELGGQWQGQGHVEGVLSSITREQFEAFETEAYVISWPIAAEIGDVLDGGLDFVSAEKAGAKCKVPKNARCALSVSTSAGKTTVTCTYEMRKLKRDKSKHTECGKIHAQIQKGCKANVASVGTPNMSAKCTARRMTNPVSLKCVPADTKTPIEIDATLNDSITR